jgi:fatty-acyl-CoA synthase
LQHSQGRRAFGVEMKLADDAGQRLPHDRAARGHLLVRGASVASGYFRDTAADGPFDRDGWFATGDVATIGPTGLLTIVDRGKDMVKSGGEWISPAEIERAAHLLPGIAQCAVIGVEHPKWGERPVLIAVADAPLTAADVLAHLGRHLPRWQVPDAVVFIDAMPVTATGKISKLLLRERYSAQELGLRDDPARP